MVRELLQQPVTAPSATEHEQPAASGRAPRRTSTNTHGTIARADPSGPPAADVLASRPARRPRGNGLPDPLRTGIEALSGVSMDGVAVRYNSPEPAAVEALAFTRGNDIHLGPGQEQHLPHEAWHVVQQAQGRVRPTLQLKGRVPVNDDAGLEREADVMGDKAMRYRIGPASTVPTTVESAPRRDGPLQRWKDTGDQDDGGGAEVDALLDGVDWDDIVDVVDRGRLAETLVPAVDAAAKGAEPKAPPKAAPKGGKRGKKGASPDASDDEAAPDKPGEVRLALLEAVTKIIGGAAPVDAFYNELYAFNAELTQAQAEAIRDAIQGAMEETARVIAEEEAAIAAGKAADAAKAKKDAADQAAALALADAKAAEDQAKLDVQAVMALFAGDPILKKLNLKAEENRNMAVGPATAEQAQTAVDLWCSMADRAQLTNFHAPGQHDEFVSKFRPPLIEVNRVLKCIVLGGKEIIVHISADAALTKRMIGYHRNQISIDSAEEKRIIPASESAAFVPR